MGANGQDRGGDEAGKRRGRRRGRAVKRAKGAKPDAGAKNPSIACWN
jgi:hypothetical protein